MSPRTEAQNEQLRAASRARILEHALELFSKHGYDRTTVRMIADSAGVAQGLLYNYFRSKDEVLRALFEQSIEKVQESFALVADAPAEQKLETLVRGSLALVQRDARFWQVSYGVRMQPAVLAGLGADLGNWTTGLRMGLEAILTEVGVAQPEVEARVLFALIDGISQHMVLEPGYPVDAVADAVLARYFPTRRKAPSKRKR